MKYEAAREQCEKIRKLLINVLVFCIVFLFSTENIFHLNEFNFRIRESFYYFHHLGNSSWQ